MQISGDDLKPLLTSIGPAFGFLLYLIRDHRRGVAENIRLQNQLLSNRQDVSEKQMDRMEGIQIKQDVQMGTFAKAIARLEDQITQLHEQNNLMLAIWKRWIPIVKRALGIPEDHDDPELKLTPKDTALDPRHAEQRAKNKKS